MNKYYSMLTEKNETNITIYGDITSFPIIESDVSSYNLSQEINKIRTGTINVYINSYGGEVSEGLAIYNSLKRHPAKIKTFCDGFAASIASVVFMAGDERIMTESALLFVHNAWKHATGNSNDLRKQADDLEKITEASINAYMSKINITREQLVNMLNDETWILPKDALRMKFASSITEDNKNLNASQCVKKHMQKIITSQLDDKRTDLKAFLSSIKK